jgi:hypothetical protein
VIADGGYLGTGLIIPHRRALGQAELPARKEEHNAPHRKVHARAEDAFARMKTFRRTVRRAAVREYVPADVGVRHRAALGEPDRVGRRRRGDRARVLEDYI